MNQRVFTFWWEFVGLNDSWLERARCERVIDGFKRGREGFDLGGREVWGEEVWEEKVWGEGTSGKDGGGWGHEAYLFPYEHLLDEVALLRCLFFSVRL